ncbi:thioesterase [Planktothrix sp. FACHB-1355]|uniref:thioesterase II family protein n=1 Tax=Planktothrix sp. FACHB-1355 TaxID=2692854 RepID=UPI00168B9A25|nr:alpha/beta fold hydrolase [Planktothrix sp. FACHB-1355]MBD3557360.1 thioesterase [Planktothrix sp. FACHB-1355]
MISRKNDWFRIFAPRPEAICRLFCFHYAGGGASMFHSWLRHLPEDIEMVAVQLPGRENRFLETPVKNLGDLIKKLYSETAPLLHKPFIVFGHSMGALIGFEWTHYLAENQKQTPERLIVSGRQSPHLPRKFPPIHHLPEEEFIREIVKFDGIPAEILNDVELRALFFPTLRADLEMCEKYVFREKAKLKVPISVYGGKTDAGVNEKELAAWERVTENYAGLKLFEGDHFYFRNSREAFLNSFAEELEAAVKNMRLKKSSAIFFSKPNL